MASGSGAGAAGTPATQPASTPTTPTSAPSFELKQYTVEWNGRLFPTAGSFRSYLIRHGVNWSGFVQQHPAVVAQAALPYVEWNSQRFYDQASLVHELALQHVPYERWAQRHPEAAAILAGQPVPTARHTQARMLSKRVPVSWSGIGFTTPEGLRTYFAEHGRPYWDAFLTEHPDVVKRFDLASVVLNGTAIYTRGQLSRWLAAHNSSLDQWELLNPGAAERLMP